MFEKHYSRPNSGIISVETTQANRLSNTYALSEYT